MDKYYTVRDGKDELLGRYTTLFEELLIEEDIGWCFCKNELPEKDGDYMCANEAGAVYASPYYGGSFASPKVVWWYKHPKPPKDVPFVATGNEIHEPWQRRIQLLETRMNKLDGEGDDE